MKLNQSVCSIKRSLLIKKVHHISLLMLVIIFTAVISGCWFFPKEESFKVSYSGNGADAGTVPVDSNSYNPDDTTLVLGNSGLLECGDCIFSGWNTKADGSGTSCIEGDSITVSSNLTLFAVWVDPAPSYHSVIYMDNQSTDGEVPVDPDIYLAGSQAEVKGNENGLVKNGRSFICWNTEADRSGIDYQEDDLITVSGGDAVLYAVWELIAGTVFSYPTDIIDIDLIYVPAKQVYYLGTDDIIDPSGPALVSKFEVPEVLWRTVEEWAEARDTNSYTLSSAKQGYSSQSGVSNEMHPATDVTWGLSNVWLNALTEYYNETYGTDMRCVYYSNSNLTIPLRIAIRNNTGGPPIPGTELDPYIDLSADGFRLATLEEYSLVCRYIGDFNSDGDILDPGEYYPNDYATGADMPLGTTDGIVDFDQDGDIDSAFDLAWVDLSLADALYNSYGEIMQLKPTPLGFYDLTGNASENLLDRGTYMTYPGFYYHGPDAIHNIDIAPFNVFEIRPITDHTILFSFRIAKNMPE